MTLKCICISMYLICIIFLVYRYIYKLFSKINMRYKNLQILLKIRGVIFRENTEKMERSIISLNWSAISCTLLVLSIFGIVFTSIHELL